MRHDRQRTDMKLVILAAFERLCERSTYTRIGVGDICSEAHISKPTFYRHFQNKENIIRWMSKLALRCGVIEIGRTYTWLQGYYLTQLVQYQHRVFYCDEQSFEMIRNLRAFCADYHRDSLVETITKLHGAELTERLEFQIEALLVEEGHLSRRWAEGGMKIAPRTMAEYFASTVPYDLYHLLNVPVDPLAGKDRLASLVRAGYLPDGDLEIDI